jgi:hypothetical protein
MAAKFANKTFTEPLFFLCEGNADCAFVRAALAHRGKTSGYSIRSMSHQDLNTGAWIPGGVDNLGSALSAYRQTTGFDPNVKHVVVVIDNDADPAANFAKARTQVLSTATAFKPSLGVPNQPHVRANGNQGDVAVTILTVPWIGLTGNLEKLLLPALRRARPQVAACADTYEGCALIAGWASDTKKDKMRVRTILAAWEDDPEIGIGKIWIEAPELIPLTDPSLQQMIDCLSAQTP